jgi:hypothetical protein
MSPFTRIFFTKYTFNMKKNITQKSNINYGHSFYINCIVLIVLYNYVLRNIMLIEKSTKYETRFLIRLEKDWTDLNVKVNFQERLFALNIKSSEKFYIKILSHTFLYKTEWFAKMLIVLSRNHHEASQCLL